ncbi:MAG: hypothetical protein PHC46_00020 [Clostridia bacterium]|nr:hypothetical protein [Clostridia bacterium]
MPASFTIWQILGLWAFPVAAMAVGGFIAYKILTKAAKKGYRTIRPSANRKYNRNIVEQYDKELSAGRKLGKHSERHRNRKKLNAFQRFLQRRFPKLYTKKGLSERAKNKRLKAIEKRSRYLDEQDVEYRAPYYQSLRGNHTRRIPEQIERVANKQNKSYSAKEYVNLNRYNHRLNDFSMIHTSSLKAKDYFEKLAQEKDVKYKAKDNNFVFNRLNVYTSKTADQPIEYLNAKDKDIFYSASALMLNDLLATTKNDSYPLSISQTLVKDGKEQRQQKDFSRSELEKLARDYEKLAKANQKTSKDNSQQEQNQEIPENTL